MIANSPPLISACSESSNMVNDSSESDPLKRKPQTHSHSQNTSTHNFEAELYMTSSPMDHTDCQFLKETKMTLIAFTLSAMRGGVEYRYTKLISRIG